MSYALQAALSALSTSGVIAYPTEAVFGIGCDPTSEIALRRVLELKGREEHKGFILIASRQSQLEPFIEPISPESQRQLDAAWPGPVTFVVKAATQAHPLLTGHRETLAVRVSDHPLVRALCEGFGSAIVSTSANYSGQAPLITAAQVNEAFGDRIDVVVDEAVGTLASPTRIFDLASGKQLR